MHDEDIAPEFAEAVKISEWIKAHQRTDFTGNTCMVCGFGPEGRHPLQLPPARPSSRIRRVNGRFTRVVTPSVMTTPEMLDLKRRARQSISTTDGKVRVGLAFFDYATALIRSCYTVTDDELQMLQSGSDWHRPIMLHLGDGEELVRFSAAMKGERV